MRWSAESRICIAVAVAAVYKEDVDISPRPRMPRRAFNIGNGPRIAAFAAFAADCENARPKFPDDANTNDQCSVCNPMSNC